MTVSYSTELPREVFVSRVEVIPFTSSTLTDEQFLKGEDLGPVVTLAGELRIPVSLSSAKLPLIIITHGSGGINSANQSWVFDLNSEGYATFLIDSFSGRGLTQVSTDQTKLGRFAGVLDIYRAFEKLSDHPRIDINRVAIVGTSRGGTAAIYTAMKRFQDKWSQKFKALASYPMYPSCFDKIEQDEAITMPIHAFYGEMDDLASKDSCERWIERLSRAGKNATYIEYPNANHSFDSLLGSKTPTVSKGEKTLRNCRISEVSGVLINTDEQKPYSYQDACVSVDPKVGYDPVAAKLAHKSVIDDLKKLFNQ